MSAGFTPLRSVLGFSERVHGWVKKLIGRARRGCAKVSYFQAVTGEGYNRICFEFKKRNYFWATACSHLSLLDQLYKSGLISQGRQVAQIVDIVGSYVP